MGTKGDLESLSREAARKHHLLSHHVIPAPILDMGAGMQSSEPSLLIWIPDQVGNDNFRAASSTTPEGVGFVLSGIARSLDKAGRRSNPGGVGRPLPATQIASPPAYGGMVSQ